jgi:hypothetical protein
MMHIETRHNATPEFRSVHWAVRSNHTVLLSELMKLVHVNTLLEIAGDMGELAIHPPESADEIIVGDERRAALILVEDAGRICADFGFNALFLEVERNRECVEEGCTFAEFGRFADNLKTRIIDEFQDVLLLWIEEKKYYAQPELFGPQVAERFKGASLDIEEAGSCYAVGRYTACVFHLMRVAEFGLMAIGKRVGFPDDRPMWEPVLKFISAELNRNHNEISALFKGDIEFIAGISAHMHAVNLAWRRRVAHVERAYTKEEAKRIMDETKNLMQHIAEKLSEGE